THARAPPLSVRHTGGKGQTKGEGAGRPEGAAAAAAARHDERGRGGFLAADAAEPLLPPRPRPPFSAPRPLPRRSRVPAPPPPRFASGARRAPGARRLKRARAGGRPRGLRAKTPPRPPRLVPRPEPA
ncbi:unnamed protein product, partial [Rangifer tarandus platyrhynchus]